MKTWKTIFALAFATCFALFSTQAVACDRSNLMIQDIIDLGNNQFRIEMTMCTGAGSEAGAYGGDGHTGNVAFFVYGASVTQFTPSYTSPQTSEQYTGFYASGDSIIGYQGGPGWFADLFQGSIQDVCADVYLVTNGLPDSITVRGLEGADNIQAGCQGVTTKVVPTCADLDIDLGTGHQVFVGYAPAECTDLIANVSGGTPPYSYSWNIGQTSQSINVCPSDPATYRVTVTDAAGCVEIGYVSVSVEDVGCGRNGNKVVICDNGQTRCVPAHRVDTYLQRGASIGSCKANKTGGMIEEFDKDEFSLQVFPNPVIESATLRFLVPESGQTTVAVYNLQGSKVATLFEGTAEAGFELESSFRKGDLPAGMYLARLVTVSGLEITEKLVVR